MALTSLLFLFGFSAGIVSAFTIRPIYGLYTYLAVFYLHPPSRWWGAMLPDMRWSLIAAVSTLLAIYIHKDKFPPKYRLLESPIFIAFVFYVVWMWLQLLFVPSTYQLDGVVLFTKYVLLIYLIVRIVDNENDLFGFCFAHALGCAFFGWLVFQAPDAGRLEGVGGPGVDDANSLGMHLGTGLFFASFLLFLCKGRLRYFTLLLIPFIANGIIQTETRGAIVGVVLGAVVTFFFKPNRIKKAYYVLSVLALAGVALYANEAFLSRMASMNAAMDEQQEWDSSARSRIVLAEAQLKMFVDNPLGVGHQGTAFRSRDYLEEQWLASNSGDRASHNTVLSILVDQGIVGITVFLVLMILILSRLLNVRRVFKKSNSANLGIYATMLSGALASIFGSGMFAQFLKAEVQVWCIALVIVLANLLNDDSQERVNAGKRVLG